MPESRPPTVGDVFAWLESGTRAADFNLAPRKAALARLALDLARKGAEAMEAERQNTRWCRDCGHTERDHGWMGCLHTECDCPEDPMDPQRVDEPARWLTQDDVEPEAEE